MCTHKLHLFNSVYGAGIIIIVHMLLSFSPSLCSHTVTGTGVLLVVRTLLTAQRLISAFAVQLIPHCDLWPLTVPHTLSPYFTEVCIMFKLVFLI